MHAGMKALAAAMAILPVSAGCGPDEGGTTKATTGLDATGDTTGGTANPGTGTGPGSDSEGGTEPTGDGPTGDPVVDNHPVDILFVIDNSGSMGEEQQLLSENLPAFLNVLDGYQADYRIAITTTDSGNPRCPQAIYKSEGGQFVLSSCLDRIDQDEFKFGEDDFSSACTSRCTKRDADLTVLPTATEVDGVASARDWIESAPGKSNIAGASVLEALQCYLPQGVAGCGFESHLESMYRALTRAQDSTSPSNYGFLRDSAQLAVIIVTDEADCSYTPTQTDIFSTNKVFWNSPDAPAPTSALCWRAGVECSGGPGTYSECHAQNYDANAGVTDSAEDAVLQPISKYVKFVKEIEAQKQLMSPGRRVKVGLLAGVPKGYESFAAEIPYEDSADSQLQANFGIGPGCVLDAGTAVPPVREREFAEAFVEPGKRNLYSICQQDYSAALKAIAEDIRDGY